MRRLSVLFVLCFFWPQLAAAQAGFISVEDAYKQTKAGEVMLIDVRSVREWRKTGLPAGGHAITIHNRKGIQGFVDEVLAATKGDRTRKIALICASGVRSTVAAKGLSRAGYRNLFNVREGMQGNRHDGPGWIKRKLPVERCRNCKKRLAD